MALHEPLESRTLMSVSPVPVRVSHPLLNTAQTQDIKKLTKDLTTLYRKGHISTAELLQLESDASTALAGATKPSASSLAKLKLDLKTSFADKTLSTTEKLELAVDVESVLTSANVSTTSAQAVATDMNAIISSSGITTADEKLILTDVKALLSTFKTSRA